MSTAEQLLARLLTCKCFWVLVTRYHLFVLTLGYDLLNFHWTFLWAFFITNKCASVSLITYNLLTLLVTLIPLVLWVVWMTDSRTNMAAFQTELARLGAASLRCLFEIFSRRCLYLSIWMILTAQSQSFPNLVLLPQGVEDFAPQFDLVQHQTVAYAVETFLGT